MKIKKRHSKQFNRIVWDIDFTLDGERYREPDFQTKQDAMDFFLDCKDRQRRIRHGLTARLKAPVLITLQQAFDKHTELNKHRENWRKEGPALKRFIEWLDEKQNILHVAMITKDHTAAYRAALHAQEYADGTVTTMLSHVSALLHQAKDSFNEDLRGWDVPKISKPGGAVRSRLLSAHELIAVHRALLTPRQAFNVRLERESHMRFRHDLADLWLLGFFTGARVSELLAVQNNAVNFEHETLIIKATKTKRPGTRQPTERLLSLSPTALEVLRRRCETHSGKIFRDYKTSKVRETLRRTCEKHELNYGRHNADGFTFHDARRTMATVLNENGFETNTIGNFLGHSDYARQRKQVTNVYFSSRPERRKAAVVVLENYWQTACRDFDGKDKTNGHEQPLLDTQQDFSIAVNC